MTTAFNPQRQAYAKYDDNHYLLFLNEQEAVQTDGQTQQTVQGYTYTGTRPDGSTLIEATDVNSANRRGKFIAGLIGTQYSQDDQIALLANGEDSNEHAEELAIFHQNRQTAKQSIDELLSRDI